MVSIIFIKIKVFIVTFYLYHALFEPLRHPVVHFVPFRDFAFHFVHSVAPSSRAIFVPNFFFAFQRAFLEIYLLLWLPPRLFLVQLPLFWVIPS